MLGVLKMKREIKIINKEKYIKNKDGIPDDFKVIIDDNIKIKGYFDKRSKIVKKQNSDTVNVYKSKPSLRLYFYNTITKKKTDLKKDDKYIFVGDKLYLEIQASGEKYGCYLVSKFKTKKVLSYKD